MAADGLTTALSIADHESFVGMTSIEDQKDLLASIKKEEDLKDALQKHRTGTEYSAAFGFGADAT